MGIIRRKSFTLIELIVAVGVIAIVLPTVFNIFFIIIRQQLVLMSYQTMQQQGDSAERNIKNLLKNRAAYLSGSDYASTNICPLITTPTPTRSPDMYIVDKDGAHIHLHTTTLAIPTPATLIASDSAKQYLLTSPDVTVSDMGFTCYRVNEFSPSLVSIGFTMHKSTVFKEISLPYSFTVKVGGY